MVCKGLQEEKVHVPTAAESHEPHLPHFRIDILISLAIYLKVSREPFGSIEDKLIEMLQFPETEVMGRKDRKHRLTSNTLIN